MTKTTVKFRKNWYKTVGGVAPTRYPLSIHFVIDNARKMFQLALSQLYVTIFALVEIKNLALNLNSVCGGGGGGGNCRLVQLLYRGLHRY